MPYEVTLIFENWDDAQAAFDAIDFSMGLLPPDGWFMSMGPEPDEWVDGIRALTKLRTKARPARG
jgi:hypothetical protein